MTDFFAGIDPVTYQGPDATSDLAYRHYDPNEMVAGKRLEDHLRFAVAWWHSFAWPGGDPFGGQTFDRPWFGDTMDLARMKADAAFELFAILGQPFFCFHDADIRPEGADFAESLSNLDEMGDYVGPKMETLLHALGFYHYDQIAAWTADEVAWVDQNLKGFKGRVSRDNWVTQAKALASGAETEFSQRAKKDGIYKE